MSSRCILWTRYAISRAGRESWARNPWRRNGCVLCKCPRRVEASLTILREWITILLAPGCRICLGGRMHGYQGDEPGVVEEAGLALNRGKPLYLLGGLGGATKAFIESREYAGQVREP